MHRLKNPSAVKRFIIRRLDKLSGVRQTIIIYGKDGRLHSVTKEQHDRLEKVY